VPINSKGSYTLPPSDDLEFVDDFAETSMATEDPGYMKRVVMGFETFLNQKLTKQQSSISNQSTVSNDLNVKKDLIKESMGSELFQYYYTYLR
jgi:hypothetical protein